MYKNIPRLYYNKINVKENNELYFILIDFFILMIVFRDGRALKNCHIPFGECK